MSDAFLVTLSENRENAESRSVRFAIVGESWAGVKDRAFLEVERLDEPPLFWTIKSIERVRLVV